MSGKGRSSRAQGKRRGILEGEKGDRRGSQDFPLERWQPGQRLKRAEGVLKGEGKGVRGKKRGNPGVSPIWKKFCPFNLDTARMNDEERPKEGG